MHLNGKSMRPVFLLVRLGINKFSFVIFVSDVSKTDGVLQRTNALGTVGE
jgi:hypothetical protein